MFRLKSYKIRLSAILILTLICIALCLSGLVGLKSVNADENDDRTRVVGYLPTWSYQTYKTIDFSALTHINIAFCNPDSSGEIVCGIPDNQMSAIVEKAHNNNVKVMAALGGGGYGEPYRDLISSSDKITLINQKIMNFCEKYGLDGIDLDIEITSSDIIWQNYGKWVAALRKICDERDWLLSTATAQWVAGSTTSETFNLFDYLNVMAYDNDSRGSNSHSSYDFAVECLNYFNVTKNVPKENLVLGVPFYGRGYNDKGELDWNSYMSFADLVKADKENFNADFYGNVAYTGAETMRRKCELSKEYGGIMIWEITLDSEGEYSLLGVIKGELLTDTQTPSITPEDGKADKTLWIVLGSVAGAIAISAVVIFIVMVTKRKMNKA